jgi:hypothetical protein
MRSLAICALVLLALCPPAAAQPIRYQVDLTFDDGGEAHGYIVHDRNRRRLADFAVTVSGGAEADFPPFVFDPTTSLNIVDPFLPEMLGPTGIWLFANDFSQRLLRFEISGLGGLTLVAALTFEQYLGGAPAARVGVEGAFTRVAAPVITLKVNSQHPADRVVTSTGPLSLTLDLAPGGWTGGALDWYWALALNGNVYWVTGSGVSDVPAPFGVFAPFFAEGGVLFDTHLAPGTTLTTVLFAMDGDTLVSFDAITAVVAAPETGGGG